MAKIKELTLTKDELAALLEGAIYLYIEYKKKHSQSSADALNSAIVEVLESVDNG
jgi:hypothetical protein